MVDAVLIFAVAAVIGFIAALIAGLNALLDCLRQRWPFEPTLAILLCMFPCILIGTRFGDRAGIFCTAGCVLITTLLGEVLMHKQMRTAARNHHQCTQATEVNNNRSGIKVKEGGSGE